MRKKSLECVYLLAKQQNLGEKVVFIGSDLGPGVMENFKEEFPNKFFMEGISEQHVVGMASGLAMDGFVPYVNTISTFLTRRCYEQIAIDVCLHNLPVRLIGNGGGFVYAPLGPTHQATDDIALMRNLPNMTIISPADAYEMEKLMMQTLTWRSPIYIRLAKGGDQIIGSSRHQYEIGKGVIYKEPIDGLFITTGVMAQKAIKAIEDLSNESIDVGLLHLHTIKPLDEKLIKKYLNKIQNIIVVEEHSSIGGLGSAILELSQNYKINNNNIERICIPDVFNDKYGSQEELFKHYGLDSDNLTKKMKSLVKSE